MKKRMCFAWLLLIVILINLLPYSASAACAHKNTKRRLLQTLKKPISGDNDYHSVIKTYLLDCKDCGATAFDSEDDISEEKHTLNKNGYCSVCRYQTEVECEHDDTRRIQLGNTSYNQIRGDDEYHEVEKHYKVTCRDCGITVNDDEEEYDDEMHSFDRYGKCTKCKYEIEIECDHVNTSRIQLGDTTCNQIKGDDNYHEVEKHYQISCKDCGEILDHDKEEYSKEKHSFNQYGKCTKCKYEIEIECDHVNTSRIQLGDTIYNQIKGDSVYHKAEKHYQISCEKCYEIIDYDAEEYTVEKHSFDNKQKCMICGFQIVCEHKYHSNDTYLKSVKVC